jgi:hypothetical protein
MVSRSELHRGLAREPAWTWNRPGRRAMPDSLGLETACLSHSNPYRPPRRSCPTKTGHSSLSEYYEAEEAGLGRAFVDDVERAVQILREFPR